MIGNGTDAKWCFYQGFPGRVRFRLKRDLQPPIPVAFRI